MKGLAVILRFIALGLLIYSKFNFHRWFDALKFNLDIIDMVVGFLIFFISANLVLVLLTWLYRRRRGMKGRTADNVIFGLNNIYYLVIGGGVITMILGFFGIDLKTLFTSLSIVAAAIAIVSKDYISEVISGFIISFSSEISVGDYIKIGPHKGKIIDLSLTKISFLNEDDDIIYIPNNTVYTSEIVNYTKREIRRVSIEFDVDLQAFESIEALEADLTEALKDYHQHIEKGSFWLRIFEIHKDYVSLKFQYVLKKIDRDLEIQIRRRTVRRIVAYVKAHYKGAK